MKHYAYTIFSNTLMSFVHRYVAKYGSDATMREKAFTRITGTGKNFLNLEFWNASNPGSRVYSGAAIERPNAKAHEERHEDVVIDGRWQGGTQKQLEQVKPWDTLIPIGHGMVYKGTQQIIFNKCSNDAGDQTRTFNDLVNWFGPDQDNLGKDHVIIKLAMCYGGGGGEEAPADCFAKQLAMALDKAGWKTIAVGGYRGALLSGGLGTQTASSTTGNKETFSRVVFTPGKNKVQRLGSNTILPGKENLIYFDGSGVILKDSQVSNVKAILQGFPASASQDVQRSYVQNLRIQFKAQAPEDLKSFPGKVLEMLEKRLGITVAPVQNLQPPVQALAKPQTQTTAKTQTHTSTQQNIQTGIQSQAQATKGKMCKKCGLWPMTTPGWKCPNGCIASLTPYSS